MEQNMRADRLDGRQVTFEQLRAFVFVAKHGGFTRAGEELGRTQSTLSLSIKRLEEDIGCRLINRRQGQIIGLTNEGKQLLPVAKDILFRMTQALHSVKSFQLRGRIALGVPDDFNIKNLHQAISWCLEKNPGLKIEITAAPSPILSAMTEKQQLDVVILKSVEGKSINTETETLLQIEPLHWVASKDLYFNELQEIPLVTFSEGCVIRACAIKALEDMNKPYFLAYVSASFSNISSAIQHGLGIGLLPDSAITDDLCILSSKHAVPGVPAIQLALKIVTQGELYTLFAEYLRRSLAES
ncbi:LysR family transcriptional regulator [Xenorhabdus sp. PB30.3]|uniref:LysR family transcriptional regulator n=1 Tax=Xenorhabdus sp. PB30.3 TaxID=2788941 RepID=UPI001E55D5F2|nr:LysR family transcriptional regulator [Xenorhabdus sp. PB30.3]